MATRFDILAPRKKYNDDGTWWHRVGTAFEAKDGNGFNCEFDSLPVPDSEGKVKVIIRQAKDLSDAIGTGRRKSVPHSSHQAPPISDDIPF